MIYQYCRQCGMFREFYEDEFEDIRCDECGEKLIEDDDEEDGLSDYDEF